MTEKTKATYYWKKLMNQISLLTTSSEDNWLIDFFFLFKGEGYFGLMKTQARYNTWFQRNSLTKISASNFNYFLLHQWFTLSIHWSNLIPDHKSSHTLKSYKIAEKASWVVTIKNIHKASHFVLHILREDENMSLK